MEDPTDDDKELKGSLTVAQALAMFEGYRTYWSDSYREASIDLKMYTGDRGAHWGEGWDASYKAVPAGQPAMVVNQLPQYVHQVCNDIRQNVPSIKVLPVADGDIETGKIYTGLFRAIEDHSHADEVCDTAAEYAVKCSIGFMRLDHEYCSDEGDEQEIIFKTVPDPLSIWLDPASIEYDGRDANGAIALEPINKADFDRLYKGKAFKSFTDPKNTELKDSIVIAEIFIREFTDKRGKKAIIHRYKFSGEERLEYTTFPGKYIPVVPIYGEVTWVDGKRILSSLLRQARDPQRRLNHWAGKESQVLSMAPIAPIMAEEGTLVNERRQWQSPGTEMVLEYKRTNLDGLPANVPTRLQAPQVPAGYINAMEGAKENIKESMGIYNAGLGKREGDASGIALQQLDKSGDVATFHYPDNVRRSYGHMGEIAVDMMPFVYDTPRIIQTLNDETDVVMVGVNGAPIQEGQKQSYDLTKGKYRVRVTTGASYTTKRQEEAAFLGNLFQKDPALMQIGGDILFKSMDTPGAQALAARFKKTIPPQLLDEQQNAPPDAEKQQMAQVIQQGHAEMQQLQQQMGQLQQELKSKQLESDTKVHDTQTRAQVDMEKMQVEREKLMLERDKLILLDKQLDIQAREVELKYPPRNDTEQQILEHSLDERAADTQLQRDLLQQAVTTAMQPEPKPDDTQGATAAP